MLTPSNFKEYLRLFYSRFIVAAGVAVGVAVIGIILILWRGGWPAEHYGQIIDYLGWLALGGGGVMVIVIVFLGLGGPAKNFKVGFRNFTIETEGDE